MDYQYICNGKKFTDKQILDDYLEREKLVIKAVQPVSSTIQIIHTQPK